MEAFHLASDPGRRFALFRDTDHGEARGTVLYVHPFGEEMNKSRRTAALQARAFAAAGYAVLQVDLYGCGDSDGEFADARWDIWKQDLERASDWLARRAPGPIHLWALRLGAALGIAHWRDDPQRYASALLWQPVVDGRAYITQFLRVAVARHAIRGGGARATTQGLRNALASNEPVEIAGYALSPALAGAIDMQDLREWCIPGAHVHWFDVRTPGSEPGALTRETLGRWRERGVDVTHHVVEDENFWTSIDVLEANRLVEATTSIYASSALVCEPVEAAASR